MCRDVLGETRRKKQEEIGQNQAMVKHKANRQRSKRHAAVEILQNPES